MPLRRIPGASVERSALQYEVAFRVGLVARRFRGRFTERMAGSVQTEPRWTALYFLNEEPNGLIQAELSERMGIQGSTVVRIIDGLERAGLVRREELKADRRVRRVVIQPEGKRVVEDVDVVAAKLRDEVFDGISAADLLITAVVLEKLGGRLAPPDLTSPNGEQSKARWQSNDIRPPADRPLIAGE